MIKFQGFLRDSLVNGLGIAGGQIILLIATPFLARMYLPEQFGVYASLVAVASIIATGASFRMDMALPAAANDDAAPILRFGLLACGLTLVIGMAATALNMHYLLSWKLMTASPFFAELCVISGVLQGLSLLALAVAVRNGNFKQTALLRLLQPSVFVFAALCAVPGGLNAAFCIGLVVVGLVGLAISSNELRSHVPWTTLVNSAKKNWEYTVISLPMALLDTLTLAMPLLFIVAQYGENAAGNFSQVQRLVAAPLLLAAAALSQVFHKHAADAHRAAISIRPFMWKTVSKLALAGFALLVITFLLGEPVLSIFLGKMWRTDTWFLLFILIPVATRLVVSPITSVFLICRRIRLGALWQLLYFVVSYSALSVASSRLVFDEFLLVFLVSELFMYSLYLWMADIAVRIPVNQMELK